MLLNVVGKLDTPTVWKSYLDLQNFPNHTHMLYHWLLPVSQWWIVVDKTYTKDCPCVCCICFYCTSSIVVDSSRVDCSPLGRVNSSHYVYGLCIDQHRTQNSLAIANPSRIGQPGNPCMMSSQWHCLLFLSRRVCKRFVVVETGISRENNLRKKCCRVGFDIGLLHKHRNRFFSQVTVMLVQPHTRNSCVVGVGLDIVPVCIPNKTWYLGWCGGVVLLVSTNQSIDIKHKDILPCRG